jgi:hypothetical protein
MEYKADKIMEEEIIEKINFIIIFSLTFLIYIICFLLILFRSKGPRESILNNIKIKDIYKQETVFDKNWFYLTDGYTLKTKSDKLYEKLINNNIPFINYNIINEYDSSIFNLEYYDYQLIYQNMDIKQNNENNNYYDFTLNSLQNSTNMIKFKSKENIINLIPKLFKFTPVCPFLFKDSVLLTINAIYSINKIGIDIAEEIKSIKSDIKINNNTNIRISKDLILLNYNESLDISKVNNII